MDNNRIDQNRIYVAIDLKSFYASVECVERGLDPLTTNLVVADNSRTDKTICLAVTPSLKAYGLSGRSRLFEVNHKLESVEARTGKKVEFIIAKPRMALYMKYSTDIYNIYMDYISFEDICVYSVDEVFIDVTDYLKFYKLSARELTRKMIQEVKTRTGITATAGIGTNIYLAKVAMDIVAKHIPADEDGVRIAELDELSYRKNLWEHEPITDFWRIGPGIARRLKANGIKCMGDLAMMSLHNPDWLYKQFGVDAEILMDHAWGYEPCTMKHIKNYKPKSKCHGAGQVLMEPYTTEKAKIVTREMAELLVLDMVDKGLATSSVTLLIGYDRINVDSGNYDGPVVVDHYGRTVPKSAHGSENLGTDTSSTEKIVGAFMNIFDRIVNKDLLIRRITVNANNIVETRYEQIDMFTDTVKLDKEKKLQKAMLDIKKKYGKNAILKGTNLQEGATAMERNRQIGGHKA
ncbi:MAG: DNA methylase [Eubacterium sp.]|nr:DNA methylase [Eubacterium sp.]